jgi:hypothetical protein
VKGSVFLSEFAELVRGAERTLDGVEPGDPA